MRFDHGTQFSPRYDAVHGVEEFFPPRLLCGAVRILLLGLLPLLKSVVSFAVALVYYFGFYNV